MVNNSHGHSAYLEDALLILLMNVGPGGKQARIHNGWFILDCQRLAGDVGVLRSILQQ